MKAQRPGDTIEQFIRENLVLAAPLPVPEIRLYTATPSSGLSRLGMFCDDDCEPAPPFWAYRWGGGLVLARYILDRPQSVASKRVLDLGAGCGIVGIAAAKAGATSVLAVEIDRNAITALALNAAANHADLIALKEDLLDGPPPAVDIILVGDLYYEARTAVRATAFLDRCLDAGIEILIGDPYRAHLPVARLHLLADYAMPDFGDAPPTTRRCGVFSLDRAIY